MKFKAIMILGLAVLGGAFLLAGCGFKQGSNSDVKTIPRMTDADIGKGHQLIADNCGGCHAEGQGGTFSRISYARKSPEGWDMTIARMINFHGLEIQLDDRRAIVKYLANRQGLAPDEAKGFRYILERRPNFQEVGHDDDLMHMCARCHSYARFALQRRDRDEWVLLANMHLGQWPPAEYQMYSRERDWWADATHEVPDKLAKAYPLSTPAWEEWKSGGTPVLDGSWRVTGHRPGKGDYQGLAKIITSPSGDLNVTYDLAYSDGKRFKGSTTATIFTGFEWRGQGNLDGGDIQEVYVVSRDGQQITGRWFAENADEIGGDMEALRVDSAPTIMSVLPAYVKSGQEVEITINGVGLGGAVDLGAGIIVSSISDDPTKIIVRARVEKDVTPGLRKIKVGGVSGPSLTVYNKVDYVKVTPGYAVARAGGAGGPIAPVTAQFEAVGYLNGPDGKAGTDDDIPIGVLTASWSLTPFDDTAAKQQDVAYAGQIDAGGYFVPGPAGPNPKRQFSGGNAGNLNVVASVKDGAAVVTGKAHLIVTVQRWNSPPIH